MNPFRNSDAHLVSQVLRGQKDRYAQLVERYLPAVQAVARAHAGAFADAEDIAQEAFTDAYRRLDTLREGNKFAHWLMRIVRNKAVDWVAAEIRERSKREVAGAGIQGGQETFTPEQRELYELLHHELDAMLPEQREVLALFHFAGHRTQEIAAMLGLSNAAVRKRLQRGREALGERMLRRMEEIKPESTAKRNRARSIYGAAVSLPASWEGNAVSAGAGVASALGWHAGTVKVVGLVSLACAGIASVYWWSTRPAHLEHDRQLSPQRAQQEVEEATTPVTAPEMTSATQEQEGAKDRLPSGDGVVYGVVYDVNDVPLAGTEVHLVLYSHVPVDGVYCLAYPSERSDVSGVFRFEHLPLRGEWFTLWAVSPDGGSAATDSELLHTDFPLNKRFLELEPAQLIAGLVVDALNSPVAGAEVAPSGFQEPDSQTILSQFLMPSVLTDTSGAFRIDYLKAGQWHFNVRAPGFGATSLGPVAAGTDAGTVVLQPSIALAGRVVHESTGAPLGGVAVEAVTRDRPSMQWASATSDAAGDFHLEGLSPGVWQVSPRANWYGDPVLVTLDAQSPTPDVLLPTCPGGEIHGHVREAKSGAPVAGMPVYAEAGRYVEAISDAEGYYVLAGLPAQDLKVRTGESSIENEVVLALGRGEIREGVDFTLATGERSVTGVVLDVAGTPMAGVEVEAFGQRSNVAPRRATTGADGRFEFTGLLPADQFWIRGRKTGLIGRDCYRDLRNSDLTDIEIVMESPAGFSGQLLDERGKPLVGFSLSARSRDASQYTSRGAKSTARGRFAFPGLVSGTYTVSAGLDNGPKRELGQVTLAPGEEKTDVILKSKAGPALEIAGRVVDGAGKPVVNSLVNLLRSRSDAGYANSDALGRFRFEGLEAGLYEIEFRNTGYSVVSLLDIAAGTAGLEVVQLPAARVAGRILTQGGLPVNNAGITWFDGVRSEVTQYDRMDAQAIQNPEGAFTLVNVNAGTVTIAAWAEGFSPTFTTLVLEGGEARTGVELRLAPEAPAAPEPSSMATTALHGLVINERKEPVEGAYLYLNHSSHPTDRSGRAHATSGPDGRFIIESADLDTARVLAWHRDYAPAGTAVALSAKAAHDVTLTMASGGTVQGRLTGGGRPLEGAHLSIDSTVLGERFYDNYYPDIDGRYRAAHVAAGETTINLHYKDRWYKFPVTVPERGSITADLDILTGSAAIDGTLYFQGNPVQGQINVALPLPGGEEERFSVQTSQQGRFYLDALPAGGLQLEGLLDNGTRRTVDVETSSDSATVVELEVDTASTE